MIFQFSKNKGDEVENVRQLRTSTRSSGLEVFCKKGVLASIFIKKETQILRRFRNNLQNISCGCFLSTQEIECNNVINNFSIKINTNLIHSLIFHSFFILRQYCKTLKIKQQQYRKLPFCNVWTCGTVRLQSSIQTIK